ncbi:MULTISPECIES: hypothetical protein [unclassified Microcoleus]|uniref:hypothetical protein n=1 Tax=unclassified Microcoleus TaxID=2642155 RepID=UPI002FD4CB44
MLREIIVEGAIACLGWGGISLFNAFSRSRSIALLVTNVFAGKRDRPSSIPDAKPAIALLE